MPARHCGDFLSAAAGAGVVPGQAARTGMTAMTHGRWRPGQRRPAVAGPPRSGGRIDGVAERVRPEHRRPRVGSGSAAGHAAWAVRVAARVRTMRWTVMARSAASRPRGASRMPWRGRAVRNAGRAATQVPAVSSAAGTQPGSSARQGPPRGGDAEGCQEDQQRQDRRGQQGGAHRLPGPGARRLGRSVVALQDQLACRR